MKPFAFLFIVCSIAALNAAASEVCTLDQDKKFSNLMAVYDADGNKLTDSKDEAELLQKPIDELRKKDSCREFNTYTCRFAEVSPGYFGVVKERDGKRLGGAWTSLSHGLANLDILRSLEVCAEVVSETCDLQPLEDGYFAILNAEGEKISPKHFKTKTMLWKLNRLQQAGVCAMTVEHKCEIQEVYPDSDEKAVYSKSAETRRRLSQVNRWSSSVERSLRRLQEAGVCAE